MASKNQKSAAVAAPSKSNRGRKPLDPNQSPSDRFSVEATGRMDRALAAIESIGRLGTDNYESTADQRKRMRTALTDGIERAFKRLEEKPKAVKKALFRF